MKKPVLIVGGLVVTTITIWNSWLFFDWKNKNSLWFASLRNPVSGFMSKVSGEGTQESQLWQDIKKTAIGESPEGTFEPIFHESVLAADGTRVELTGVGFLLSSGLHINEENEEVVTEFLLLPAEGGVAWCCGLTPISKHEFSVLVDCADNPFSASKFDPKNPSFFVRVDGTLRLERENTINALYTLEDIAIDFLDIQDVLPPNVINICLDQPMLSSDSVISDR